LSKHAYQKGGVTGSSLGPGDPRAPGREVIHRLSPVLSRSKVIHRLLTTNDIYLLTHHIGGE